MSMLILLQSLPVLATVLFCPSIHGPPPGSALHNSPSLSAAGQSTPTTTTSKRKKNVNKTTLLDRKIRPRFQPLCIK